MIRSFRSRALERLFLNGDRRRLPADMVARIEQILGDLHVAGTVDELNRPSYRLHLLRGDLDGFHAVTVRANWRIIFRFEDGEAFDVDFLDYH